MTTRVNVISEERLGLNGYATIRRRMSSQSGGMDLSLKPACVYDSRNRLEPRVLKYTLLSFVLLFLLSLATQAQSAAQARPNPSLSADKDAPGEQHAPNSIEEEMRAKRAIRYAEEEHKGTLERAKELSELSEKIAKSFVAKNQLDREDFKRLDRLEKVAKQLRSKVGGSASDTAIKNRPTELKEAITLLAETSDSLSKLVEKTPRQVVSTTVIDEANVLLELVEIVRKFSKR